jgi:hypothetical protein
MKRNSKDEDELERKRQKVDPDHVKRMIELKQQEIAEKLKSLKGLKSTEGMTDVQKKIQEARMKATEKQVQKEATIVSRIKSSC